MHLPVVGWAFTPQKAGAHLKTPHSGPLSSRKARLGLLPALSSGYEAERRAALFNDESESADDVDASV